MAVVGMAANPLVPTRPAVIGPAERDGACPAWWSGWARLSAPRSLFSSTHPSLHHLHMQRRFGQIHVRKAYIPRIHPGSPTFLFR
jgi:hypothetical protein